MQQGYPINGLLVNLGYPRRINTGAHMFNLTAHLAHQQILTGTQAVRIAARLIAACPCETKRWRAMHELRKLQALARGAA
jgi:hypothetical protein